MCGIAGTLGPTVHPHTARVMVNALAHRGPDATGAWPSDGAALGHRRLSILDLPASDSQPFEKDYPISRVARDTGTKVLPSGIGSDEVIGGYRRHEAMLIAERHGKLPTPMRPGLAASVRRPPDRPYFNAAARRQLVADDRVGRADNAQRIGHFLTLEQWFRSHRV